VIQSVELLAKKDVSIDCLGTQCLEEKYNVEGRVILSTSVGLSISIYILDKYLENQATAIACLCRVS
jgi:hypothetical protein